MGAVSSSSSSREGGRVRGAGGRGGVAARESVWAGEERAREAQSKINKVVIRQ